MSRLQPSAITVAPEDMPTAKLDATRVCNELRKAGVAEERHAAVVALLQRTMDDYALSRLVDQTGATPSEVRRYMARLRKLVEDANKLLRPANGIHGNAARALMQNAIARGAVSPELPEALVDALYRFAAGIVRSLPPSQESQEKSPDAGAAPDRSKPKADAGKIGTARRQRKLARGFLEGWGEIDLPYAFTNNGVLYRLFAIALESVGEKQADPSRVFNEVIAAMAREAELQ